MKHIKQQGNDCALAATCMAYDLNYAFHAMEFEAKHNKTFSDAASKGRYAWLHQAYEYLNEITGSRQGWFAGKDDKIAKVNYLQRPPLNGQGVLTITHPIQGRHAVAWCDGVIFDPSAPGPVPWESYRWVSEDWRLDGWQPRRYNND